MNNVRINHLAVWVSIILMHALGFLWYGVLFGDAWMTFVGIDQETMENDSGSAGLWILNTVAIVASIYMIAWILAKLNVTSGVRGMGLSVLIAFCIHHLPLMNSNMFAGEPYGLAWITGGYVMAGLGIAGFILGSWLKKP